jgi:hypothetical protein
VAAKNTKGYGWNMMQLSIGMKDEDEEVTLQTTTRGERDMTLMKTILCANLEETDTVSTLDCRQSASDGDCRLTSVVEGLAGRKKLFARFKGTKHYVD